MRDVTAPQFEFARQARLVGTERSLTRRVRAGELVRIRTGVYLPAERWKSLTSDGQYRARVYAAAAVVRLGTQFESDSAAALWRLPTLGPWPSIVQVLGPKATGGRSSTGVHRRGAPFDDRAVTMNDVTITTLGRTVVDLSARSSFQRAVCMLDDALRVPRAGEFRHAVGVAAVTKEGLGALSESLEPRPGMARARLALAFGDGLSGSVGESLSRAHMHLLGFPPPQLQVPFFDAHGLVGYADFFWPEFSLVGEFDGKVKYNGRTYSRGHLPEEVVWAEKLREDRLRRLVRSVARWDWDVALKPVRLAERLTSHGLVAAR
jgi:hypothetical protein